MLLKEVMDIDWQRWQKKKKKRGSCVSTEIEIRHSHKRWEADWPD